MGMGPAIFIIAIMGCGEGDSPCQQVRVLEARYETQAACTAATEAALTQNTDIDFPIVAAECVAAGSKPAPPKANQVLIPGPGQADLKVSPIRS
jgi:ABC-type hemin transport system ATPase subunit